MSVEYILNFQFPLWDTLYKDTGYLDELLLSIPFMGYKSIKKT